MPAKLFHDFIGNGLHRFAGWDGGRAAIEQEMTPLRELRRDLFGLIVIATDADHLSTKQCRFAQFLLRDKAGHKDPELDP